MLSAAFSAAATNIVGVCCRRGFGIFCSLIIFVFYAVVIIIVVFVLCDIAVELLVGHCPNALELFVFGFVVVIAVVVVFAASVIIAVGLRSCAVSLYAALRAFLVEHPVCACKTQCACCDSNCCRCAYSSCSELYSAALMFVELFLHILRLKALGNFRYFSYFVVNVISLFFHSITTPLFCLIDLFCI